MNTKLSRRSFLKRSVVGAVVTSNLSLFVGLSSAAESGCLVSRSYALTVYGFNFATEAAAQNAATNQTNQGIDHPNWGLVSEDYADPDAPPCIPYNPPLQNPDPLVFRTTITQNLVTGLWSYVVNANVTFIYCRIP